jgi:hypothetical protein
MEAPPVPASLIATQGRKQGTLEIYLLMVAWSGLAEG